MPVTTPVPALTVDRVRQVVPYLESWLAWQVEHRGVPGAQVAIRLGRELVHSSAHGVADERTGEPLRPDHLFRVASHSKSFTATAVLRLVEQGRLRLDDTVGERLPGMAGSDLAQVSVRELLGHTGGIVRDGIDADWWQLEAAFPDRDQLLALAREVGKVYEPQRFFKYSNIGYGLLGLVIEEVTGQGYAEHLTADVLGPLGLADTGPEQDPVRAGDYAAGHSRPHGRERGRVGVDHVDTGALAAATGFGSTAVDLSRFFAAHVLGDDELLSDRSKRLMQRAESSVVRAGSADAYGLGLVITSIGGRRLVGHSGGYPGHITRTMVDPDSGLGVCVLTNAVDGPAEPLARGLVELVDLLLGEDGAAGPLPTGVGEAELDRVCGRYHSLWSVVDLVRGGDRVVRLNPSTPSPLDVAEELHVEDATTLRVADTHSFGAPGEQVRISLDAEGRVECIRLAGVSHWPQERYDRRRAEHWSRPGERRPG
ncbi:MULTISPECIES: serine hydrolase domain-containing protein [unclassified Serinicoccus]|uniref:serine hydrolase domain-containing protein n=1 Tax=unclassified Serinicoccus TaxID=2643101 RepID=UPI003851843F